MFGDFLGGGDSGVSVRGAAGAGGPRARTRPGASTPELQPGRLRPSSAQPIGGWCGLGAVFTLARFSRSFRVGAQQGGLAMAWTPLVLIAMNLVYAAGACPLANSPTTRAHGQLLGWGLVTLIAADALLALGNPGLWLWGGVALCGPAHGHDPGAAGHHGGGRRRQAALQWHRVWALRPDGDGVALLTVASGLAGWLWDRFGAPQTFMAGCAFGLLALLLLVLKPAVKARIRSVLRPFGARSVAAPAQRSTRSAMASMSRPSSARRQVHLQLASANLGCPCSACAGPVIAPGLRQEPIGGPAPG